MLDALPRLTPAQRRAVALANDEGALGLAAAHYHRVRGRTIRALIDLGVLEHFPPGNCHFPAGRVPLTPLGLAIARAPMVRRAESNGGAKQGMES